jgi:hypothetical protein
VELSLSGCRQVRQDSGFLLRSDRGIAAAQAFFRKALSRYLPQWPRKITLDGLMRSHLTLRYLRREDPKWKYVQVRCGQYLNNLVEQDHRAIKRRRASMGGFKSFKTAAITLAGIDLDYRIRKRQFSLGRGRYRNFGSLADLGSGPRVVRRRRQPKLCRFDPESCRDSNFERLQCNSSLKDDFGGERLRLRGAAAQSLGRHDTVVHVHHAVMGRDFAQTDAIDVQERQSIDKDIGHVDVHLAK